MEKEYGSRTNVTFGNVLFLGFAIWAILQLARRGVLNAILCILFAAFIVFIGLIAANWDIIDSLIAGAF